MSETQAPEPPAAPQPPTTQAISARLAPDPARGSSGSAGNALKAHSEGAARDRAGRLARVSGAVGTLVPWLQYRLSRIDTAALGGAAALMVAAAATLAIVLPGRSEIASLGTQLLRAQSAAGTASGLAPQSLARLVRSLPTRAEVPVVVALIDRQAQAAAVPLDVGHYTYTPPRAGSVARYEVEFAVKAAYPNIRDFINRTLTAVPAAALDKLRVERKAVGETAVSADVRFVLFVRSGA